MHKTFDFTQLGGFPLSQERLKYMQDSYSDVAGALASVCGNAILKGAENVGGTITDGWIALNGEILPFIGGAYQATFIVVEEKTNLTYQSGAQLASQILRYATPGTGAVQYNYADLKPVKTLANIRSFIDTQAMKKQQVNGEISHIGAVSKYYITVQHNEDIMTISGKFEFTHVGSNPYPDELFFVAQLPVTVPVKDTNSEFFQANALTSYDNTDGEFDHGVGKINFEQTGIFEYEKITKNLFFCPKSKATDAVYYFSHTFLL